MGYKFNPFSGTLDVVENNHSNLSNLNWSVSGHIIDTNILPDTTNSYNLGSPSFTWANIYTDIDSYLGYLNTDLAGTGINISSTPQLGLSSSTNSYFVSEAQGAPFFILSTFAGLDNEHLVNFNIQAGTFQIENILDSGAAGWDFLNVDLTNGTQTFNTSSYSNLLRLNNSTGYVEASGFFKGDGIRDGSGNKLEFSTNGALYTTFDFKQVSSNNIFATYEDFNNVILDQWSLDYSSNTGPRTFTNFSNELPDAAWTFDDKDDNGSNSAFVIKKDGNERFSVDYNGDVRMGHVTGTGGYLKTASASITALGGLTVPYFLGNSSIAGFGGQMAVLYNSATGTSYFTWLSDHTNASFFGQVLQQYDDTLGTFTLSKYTTDSSEVDYEVLLNTNFAEEVTIAKTLEVTGIGTFLDYITTGGSSSGQSIIASGLVVNENSGGTSADDFRAETTSNANAFVVDASADEVLINVDTISSEYVRVGKICHAYGGFQDQTETLSIDADTWTFITNSGNDLWTGLESDGITVVDDEIVVANTGDYVGSLSITFEGGNGKDYLFRIYNVTQSRQEGYHIGATGAGTGNYTNVSIPIYIEATANDVFQLQVYTADGTDADFLNAIFYLNYLHD